MVRAGEVDASRSCSHVWKERGVVRWEARRLLAEREMRTREMLGRSLLRDESWERKWRPTPPAPGSCQTMLKRVILLALERDEHNTGI